MRQPRLAPTHLYCYRLFAGELALTAAAPLTTAAAPGLDKPLRFVAFGDSGNGSAAQRAIGKRMTEVPFDFMLLLGDIAYPSGTTKQLDAYFFTIYRDVLRYVPAYPAIGNHERRTREGKPWFDAFVLQQPERYYSFDWGRRSLRRDRHHAARCQAARVARERSEDDEAAVEDRVRPPHDVHELVAQPASAPRRAFAKILTDNGVDIMLSGHEHQYERFRVANVNYIVSGGGGARLSYFWGNFVKQAPVHHFLSFEATARALTMRVIDIDGRTIDTLALEHGKPAGPQSPIPPENKIESDEKIHDEPDDDRHKPMKPEQKPPVSEQQPIGPSAQR